MLSSNLTALLIAAFGVGGTLLSAVFAQAISAKQRRDDAGREAKLRLELRSTETLLQSLERRRRNYVDLNAQSRQLVTALTNFLFSVMDRGFSTPEDIAALDAAKASHRNSYSELQMNGPSPVLTACSLANHALSDAYGNARKLERALRDDPTAANVRARLAQAVSVHARDALWTTLDAQRTAMRLDLGIAE